MHPHACPATRVRIVTAHRLEAVAATPPTDAVEAPGMADAPTRHVTHRGPRDRPPAAAVDVYVDDFPMLAQAESQRHNAMRASLHAIDAVFCPLSPTDPAHCTEPASVKKMLNWDACWATNKRILGWDLDTAPGTINLPAHLLARLHALLDFISPPKARVSVKQWHQLLGKLRSMLPALPGLRGLFSILQAASESWTAIASASHPACGTWSRTFVRSLTTPLRELVPASPSYMGACDASQLGMGGEWFPTDGTSPILWRQAFSTRVRNALVTFDNPTGSISISDLELAAIIAHKDVLASSQLVAERTLWMATENRAALAWSDKGLATATSARAYLLRLNSLHQRQHRFVAAHNHIAGQPIVMTDNASHLWHLTDRDLLTHFLTHCPQDSPWTLWTLAPATNSALIGLLFRQQSGHEVLYNALLLLLLRNPVARLLRQSQTRSRCPPRRRGPIAPNLCTTPADRHPHFPPSTHAVSQRGGHRPRGRPGIRRDGGP